MGRTHTTRIIGLFVGLMILLGASVAAAQSQRFKDVPPSHEAYEAVEWAASVGLTSGKGDGTTFGPDDALPRWRALLFVEKFYDNVLGAESSKAFTSGDLMVVLHKIHSAAETPPPPTTTTAPPTTTTTTTTVPAVVSAGATTVPSPSGRKAAGRCALAVPLGVYEWEWCAWAGADDPEMGKRDMERLVSKVWKEIDSEGKPSAKPRLEEGYCGPDVLGCYLPSAHTIRLDSGFTRHTLLHELAHALVSEHSTMRQCDDEWTHLASGCYHGEWYRCAADLLYARYGGIEAAGACGSPPSADPGDWVLDEPDEVVWGVIRALAAVWPEDYETVSSAVYLVARCVDDYDAGETRRLDLYLSLPSWESPDNDVEVTTRVRGETRPTRETWVAGDRVLWAPDPARLARRMLTGDEMYVSFKTASWRDTEQETYSLGESPALRLVLEACDAD